MEFLIGSYVLHTYLPQQPNFSIMNMEIFSESEKIFHYYAKPICAVHKIDSSCRHTNYIQPPAATTNPTWIPISKSMAAHSKKLSIVLILLQKKLLFMNISMWKLQTGDISSFLHWIWIEYCHYPPKQFMFSCYFAAFMSM